MKEYLLLLLVIALLSFLASTGAEGAGGAPGNAKPGFQKATFAGGCFWCMQPPFDQIEGIISTSVGYAGGKEENPTYEQVCAGTTGHLEALQVVYDPARVTYSQLLEIFWKNINPTQADGQFADHGRQYRTAIFYHDEEQKRLAEASRQSLERSGKVQGRIVTDILPATIFYPAEDYHQDYYRKNPLRYQLYHSGSGRERYLEEVWGK